MGQYELPKISNFVTIQPGQVVICQAILYSSSSYFSFVVKLKSSTIQNDACAFTAGTIIIEKQNCKGIILLARI